MPAFQLYSTGQELVSQLMKSMGMTPSPDIAGATDKQSIQLWQLATEVGQELVKENDWPDLSREFTITTVVGQAAYDIPNDVNSFDMDAEWNRTTRLPVIGSLQQFEWQMLKARLLTGTTFTALFRVQNNQVVFYNTPTNAQTIVMPYSSRGWVQDSVIPGAFRDNLAVGTDIVTFDPSLFKAALKLRWYKEKGFERSAQQEDYDRLLAQCISQGTPGRTLSLAKGSDYPYLGVINLPDTGYGT